MKKIQFIAVCLLYLQGVNAQEDPFVRLRNAAQKTSVEKTMLSAVKVSISNPNWKANIKPAIPFKPFELLDSNGRAVPPDRPVTLRSGKQITAQEYINRLNQIEKKLNSQGHTLRNKKPVVISQTVTGEAFLQGKVSGFPQPIGEFRRGENLRTFMSPEKRVGTIILKPMGVYTPVEKNEINSYNFSEINGGVTATKITTTRRLIRTDISRAMLAGAVKALKTIDVTDRKEWSLGEKETFQAGIEGTLTRHAKIYPFDPDHPDKSMSEFRVAATGRVYGSLFDHTLDLLNASGEFNAPADTSKKMTAKLVVKAGGITILNLNDSYAQSKSFNDMVAKSFDKSFPIEIPIGWGFDFQGKIGIKGDAGFGYGATLYRTFASVQGKPLANLEGYAEAGIDFLDVIGGGVGGRLTFLKGDLELQAFAGIWTQNAEQIVLAISYYFGYDLEMLKGSLYCYVEVCLPWVGCWRPVEHDFYSWDGYKRSGTISEGSASYVLANVWQTEQPVLIRQ